MGASKLVNGAQRLHEEARPSRIDFHESTPVAGRPAPRIGWSPMVVEAHRTLCDSLESLGVLTESDALIVELVAHAIADHRMAVRDRAAPAVVAAAWRRARTGLAELGLTPTSRPKLERPPEPKERNGFSWSEFQCVDRRGILTPFGR